MKKSLKKRLAMVLAAAMVFSTPVAVNKTTASAATEPTVITASTAEEDVVAKGNFNTSFSHYYKGTGNFEAVFNVHMDEIGTANWNTEFFAITTDTDRGAEGYVEYACLRADQWNNTTGNGDSTTKDWFTADADNGISGILGDDDEAKWALWRNAMKDADVEITVTRADDVFTVTRVLTAADGKKYSMVAKITQAGATESVRMFMGADASAFTISRYTYNGVEAVAVSSGAVKVSDDKTKIDYSFSAATAPANTKFEVSVTSGSAASITGSAVAAKDGIYTYSYAPTESGTYTFKVTEMKVVDGDGKYLLEGNAAATLKVVVEDGKIVSSEVPGDGEEKPPVPTPPVPTPPVPTPPVPTPPATNPPAAGTVKKVTAVSYTHLTLPTTAIV